MNILPKWRIRIMFLQDKDSKFKDQGKVKPKIEEIASEYFKGETKKSVIDFIAYLRSNKMTPQWASVNSWKILYKSKSVAFIKLWNGSWYIDPDIDFNDNGFEMYAKQEKLEKHIWKNIEPCINCLPNGQCTPGRSVKIYGKDFKNVCHAPRFKNPNDAEVDCIKKIFDYRKGIVAENKVPKTFYIGKNKREELVKKFGLPNFEMGYEVIMSYINQDIVAEKPKKTKDFNKFFGIYTEIKKNDPKINFLKLFEMGLEQYIK